MFFLFAPIHAFTNDRGANQGRQALLVTRRSRCAPDHLRATRLRVAQVQQSQLTQQVQIDRFPLDMVMD